MSLLIGGRAESIIGIYACFHHPIFGFGLDGYDPHGYVGEFLEKYGTEEDIENYKLTAQRLATIGLRVEDGGIPTHTYVGAFWTYYGIFGLVYWVYFIFVTIRYVKDDAYAVPQWYAWVACSLPGVYWDVFFSPVASRIGMPMIAVACLYARAIRLKKRSLPLAMVREIQRYAK